MSQAVAERAVSRIVRDLEDRSGLGNMWAEIDPDIQDEIRDEWASLICEELNARPETPKRNRGTACGDPTCRIAVDHQAHD